MSNLTERITEVLIQHSAGLNPDHTPNGTCNGCDWTAPTAGYALIGDLEKHHAQLLAAMLTPYTHGADEPHSDAPLEAAEELRRLTSGLEVVAADLETRGSSISGMSNQSMVGLQRAGRGEGYLEAARNIRKALGGAVAEPRFANLTTPSLDEVFESLLNEAVQLGFVDVHFAPGARASGLIGSTKQFVRFGDKVSAAQFERATALLARKNGYVYTPGARWRFMNTDGFVVIRRMPTVAEAPVGMGTLATLNESCKPLGGDRG